MATVASPVRMDRFSDHDLMDMLSFFEKSDNDPLAEHLDVPAGDIAGPLSSSSLDGSIDGEAVTAKQEQSGTSFPVITSSAMPGYCGLTAAQTVQRTLTSHSLLLAHNGAVLGVVPHPTLAAADYTMSMPLGSTQAALKESKLTVSHSTIGKQRRDRINSLIDELREIVPSAGALKGPDGADMKRPKHVVLSDTISLLKRLKDRALRDQQELHELKQAMACSPTAATPATTAFAPAASEAAGPASAAAAGILRPAQGLLQRSLSGPAGVPAAAAAAPAACPELPQAPSNLPASVGVLVEEGEGCFLVKVNCRDRRGLLSDIASAIKGLPLQITRAAITTSQGGAVYDVFEIVVEPNAQLEDISALDVQFQVHQALHRARTALRVASSPSRAGSPGASGSGEANNDAKRRRSE